MHKNILSSSVLFSSLDLSTSSNSKAVNIKLLDNIGIQVSFAGSPVGVFNVQVSIDHAQDQFGGVSNVGTWINLGATANTSGGSPIYFDLTQLSAPWIRLSYTSTSGTGTGNAFIAGKEV